MFDSICIGAQFLSGGLCNLNKKSREKTHVASINSLLRHFSLITYHSSLFTLHYSFFTLHSSLVVRHSSLLTLHYSLFIIHSSLLLEETVFPGESRTPLPGAVRRCDAQYLGKCSGRFNRRRHPGTAIERGINGKKWAKVALKSERTNIKGKKLRFRFVKLHKKSSYKLT